MVLQELLNKDNESDVDAPGGVVLVELVYGQHVGGSSKVQVLKIGHLQHLVSSRRHHLLQTSVHDILLLRPLQQRLSRLLEFAVVDLRGILNDLQEVLLRFLLPLHQQSSTFLESSPHLTCSMFLSHSK